MIVFEMLAGVQGMEKVRGPGGGAAEKVQEGLPLLKAKGTF